MFDILTGRITVAESTKRYDHAPHRGDRVTVHVETFDMRRFVLDGLIVGIEIRGVQRKTTSWEVTEIAVLVVRPDGVQTLGRFQREAATATEIKFRTRRRLRAVTDLPAKDFETLLGYLLGDAADAAKRRDHAVTVAVASRVIELCPDAENGKARFLRATAYSELREHDRALADWDEFLEYQPGHPQARHGRARTRYALGDHRGALDDAERALAAGIEGAARLIELIEPPRPPSNAVRHKTYGDGTILRRLEGDKLEIEFPAGKKTLLARFVEQI